MILKFTKEDKEFSFDSKNYYEISIKMDFNGEQPNTYHVDKAISNPYQVGDWIGDTRKGGSCNFETIKITPHCNGTHTECIGHILNDRVYINHILDDSFFIAKLISINTEKFLQTNESYKSKFEMGDYVISKQILEKHIMPNEKFDALIIRTMPNSVSKKSRSYDENPSAYFTNEAMNYLADLDCNHLIVDLPSIDRLFDEGKMLNHRIWWKVEQGSFETNQESKFKRTITEFVYIEDNIADGYYILNIQIPSFNSEAAPSRLLIHPITNK